MFNTKYYCIYYWFKKKYLNIYIHFDTIEGGKNINKKKKTVRIRFHNRVILSYKYIYFILLYANKLKGIVEYRIILNYKLVLRTNVINFLHVSFVLIIFYLFIFIVV